MNFTAKDVANLRERTGCGMMDCKKALTEADGDFDRAVELLRERGLAQQAKKASRIAAEGVVYATSSANVGVIIEVNSETDFVAKNEKFMDFVSAAAKAVMDRCEAIRPGTLDQCFHGTLEVLTETVNTQPCMLAVELAAAAALEELGVKPAFAAGFSLGEIAALACAGAASVEDAFSIVCRRAELM